MRRINFKMFLLFTLSTLVLLVGSTLIVVQAQVGPTSWHVPDEDVDGMGANGPQQVAKASTNGCNDWWAIWSPVSEANIKRAQADAGNWWNYLHIEWHDGLDGWYFCTDAARLKCNLYLCTKHGGDYNAWTVRLRW